ncbi:hypothetical protein Tco_1500776 [Tanacetum coccineum]
MGHCLIVISEDGDADEDSSKQGRKIFENDKDPTISLVHHEQDIEYDFDVSTAEGFTTPSVPVTTASASISTVSPQEFLHVKTSMVLENLSIWDEREEVVAKVNQDHDIDWSGPALLRYHIVQNSSFSKAEILDLYLKEYGDQNHAFVPKDSKIEKEVMKRPRFNLQHESTQKNEKIESKQVGLVQLRDVVV